MLESGIIDSAKNLRDGVAKFGQAVAYEAVESPIQAAYQFVDQASVKVLGAPHLPALEITKPDDSAWSSAGSFVGTVAKYVVLSKLVHHAINGSEAGAIEQNLSMYKTVKAASVESTLTGATAGFLTPVANNKDYWTEKGIGITTSAGSFGLMGGSAAAIGKSSFLGAYKGTLARATAINGIAGLAGGTAQATLDASLHNRSLSFTETAQTAGSYALFGAAFGGVAHLANTRAPELSTRANEGDALGRTGEPQKGSLSQHAERALQAVQRHASTLGDYLDNSIAKVNPFLMMNNMNDGFYGMRPAYAEASYGSGNRSWSPLSESRPTLADNRMYSLAHNASELKPLKPAAVQETTGGTRTRDLGVRSSEATTKPQLVVDKGPAKIEKSAVVKPTVEKLTAEKPVVEKPAKASAKQSEAADGEVERTAKSGKDAKTYSIRSVLSTTERGSQISDALQTLDDENPGFLKGLRAASPNIEGSGRDSIMIKLADGRYKNALLRFTTIYGEAQDTLTPKNWDPEWGERPYDAPILSSVKEVELGDDDRLFVYVQEHGTGAIKANAAYYDVNEDASFARDAADPTFQQLTDELEARGEEWVDPGSRQLVWSALKNRLVLVDYPAIMRSGDIPLEWRYRDLQEAGPRNVYDEHNDANESNDVDDEAGQPSHSILELSREEGRYEFLKRTGSPTILMQNEIAQQLFDGDSEKDMVPLIEFMFKDALSSMNISAKEAIQSTRELLRDQKLL